MPIPDLRPAARRRVPSTLGVANLGAWPEHGHADPDKARVMAWIGALIRAGHAEWGMLGNGDIELRFMTGEVFHLGETAITRVG